MANESVMAPAASGIDRTHRRLIFASSLGTVFEWFDFICTARLQCFRRIVFSAGQRHGGIPSRVLQPSVPDSRCAHSVRSCSAESATRSAANTRS